MDGKEQDIIKLWTWCGFTQYPEGRKNFHYEQTKKVMDWIYPKGHYGMGRLPRLGLSEIYEYAIPKLQDKGYWISLIAYEHNGFQAKIADTFNDEFLIADSLITAESDNPVEALYNAIMKVIDKEINGK